MKEILNRTADKRYLPERLIYLAVWGIVYAFPVVTCVFEVLSGTMEKMYWQGILRSWADMLPFLLLFLLNNSLLVPRLFLRQKVMGYVALAVLASLLIMGSVSYFDTPFAKKRKIPVERYMEQPIPMNPRMQPHREKGDWASSRDFHSAHPPVPYQKRPLFFPLMRGPFWGRMMVALLMLSFNLAVKLFFRSQRDKEAMKELERHNLQSELEYLKYQINPHFFMNTLNNIHALIDLDAEQAKHTVMELSKLMRYMLYEANKRTILLTKEVQFLRHYVKLMRIRYPDCVGIELRLPEDTGEAQVPPLLFISFVENAFKHGVSYQKKSFIFVSLELYEGYVLFRCVNSNFGKREDRCHGIGLENVRKRLRLLYGERYTLSIREEDEYFDVYMTVPVDSNL